MLKTGQKLTIIKVIGILKQVMLRIQHFGINFVTFDYIFL